MAVGKIEYKKILDDDLFTPTKLKDVYTSFLNTNVDLNKYNLNWATDPEERYTLMSPETAALLIASRQRNEEQENPTEETEQFTEQIIPEDIVASEPQFTPIQGGIWPMTMDAPITSNEPIAVSTVTPVTSVIKGSHILKSDDIDTGNMQAFLDEAAKYGIYFRITSGLRPGAKTSSGKTSHHALGNAIDVTPLPGQTYDDLMRQIRNAPELVKWMRDHKIGIYEETTQDVMKQTGATGAHWHIGPDRVAIQGLERMLA